MYLKICMHSRNNKLTSLRVLDSPMTLSSIASATKLLELLPLSLQSISLLQVKVAIPESGEGNESIGDLVGHPAYYLFTCVHPPYPNSPEFVIAIKSS